MEDGEEMGSESCSSNSQPIPETVKAVRPGSSEEEKEYTECGECGEGVSTRSEIRKFAVKGRS